MSADNWAVCPKCVSDAEVEAERKRAAVAPRRVSDHTAWLDRLRAELRPVDREAFRTFREDYEFYGAEDGEVVVSYGGSCEKCGLQCTFTERRRFWSPDAAGGASGSGGCSGDDCSLGADGQPCIHCQAGHR